VESAIAATNKGTPSVGEILDAAFSHAQAVVVLLSVTMKQDSKNSFWWITMYYYEKQLTPQARPECSFLKLEWLYGRNPDRTVLIQIGH